MTTAISKQLRKSRADIRWVHRIHKWSYSYVRKKIKKLLSDEATRGLTNLQITDHALLQYAVRVEGFDAAEAKRVIYGENLKKRVDKLGDGCYPVNGLTVIVLNNTIVTVYPEKRSFWVKAK